MRCLIIDDDESPRRLMEKLIAGAGHRVTAVRSGEDAVLALRREPHDVAIVDLEMPGMSGADTIGSLREVSPQLRVLVVSGYDDRRHVLSALAAGADGYLLKDELADTLGRSLQDVRAGHSPLSPRIASIVLRYVRPRPTASPLQPTTPVARIARPERLGMGTDELPHLTVTFNKRRPDGDPGGDADQ